MKWRLGWSFMSVACALWVGCFGILGCTSTPIAQNYSAYLERDIPTLLYYLEHGEDWVAEDAALYLGYLAAPSATPGLLAQLSTTDRSPLVYSAIVVALGRIRSEEAIPAILQYLKQQAGDSRQRLAVVLALSQMCAPNTRQALEDLKYDTDVLVSRSAKSGILRCWPGGQP